MVLDDDVDLAARAARGDTSAFEALYDRHVSRVHAHCARQLGSVQEADDLTAMVFLEAWRRRASVRVVDSSVLPWLLGRWGIVTTGPHALAMAAFNAIVLALALRLATRRSGAG